MSESSFAQAPAPSIGARLPRKAFGARPLVVAGAVSLVASLLAVVAIRAIAVSVVSVPAAFTPLKAGSVIGLTIVGVLGAIGACFGLDRVVKNPIVMFRRVAPVVLVLSFIPDIAIWAGHAYGHTARASTVVPLLIMHLAVGGICIGLLPSSIGRRQGAGGSSQPE